MLGRAELFFVVLDICYIEHNIFTTEMFYSLTFAAMFMNISVPITISLFKPYYVGEKTLPCGGKPEDEQGIDGMLLGISWARCSAASTQHIYHLAASTW